MTTSGPINKTCKDFQLSVGFNDVESVGKHVWTAVSGGKRWILKTAPDDSTASFNLLKREYEISSGLQHPAIVAALLFAEDTPVGPAIVMEYVEGRTLDSFIEENPDRALRKRILGEILDATDYIHKKGLLHNDIKPENILISDIGNHVRIIDFGLAENESDYLNRRLGGTSGASAPEVLAGDISIPSDASSDIYSLGGIISALFPKGYKAIVRKCRQQKPKDRYNSIPALEKAIRRTDRIPALVIIISAILCILGISLIPDYINRTQAASIRDARNEEIGRICSDLEKIFQDMADSLQNREIVPYAEFSYNIVNNYVTRFAGYQQSHPEHMSVCDSVYNRQYYRLQEIMSSIPDIQQALDSGQISEKEYYWYLTLSSSGKPYAPYEE